MVNRIGEKELPYGMPTCVFICLLMRSWFFPIEEEGWRSGGNVICRILEFFCQDCLVNSIKGLLEVNEKYKLDWPLPKGDFY